MPTSSSFFGLSINSAAVVLAIVLVGAVLVVVTIVNGKLNRRAVRKASADQIAAMKEVERARFNPLGFQQTLRWVEQNAQLFRDHPDLPIKARQSRAANTMKTFEYLANVQAEAMQETVRKLKEAEAAHAAVIGSQQGWDDEIAARRQLLQEQQKAYDAFNARYLEAADLIEELVHAAR